ncbi:cholinesterase-like [Diadema antillarum]|uniref:cholinesterase-like n=1 Tax=Diadema antillarum TaxID=105358 RepID=UPI003A83EB0A
MDLCLIILTISAVIWTSDADNPTVTVTEGVLVGKTVRFSENTHINKTVDVDVFLGVPYANPPERFSPPEKKTPWAGERGAMEFAAACIQSPNPEYPVMSEDCLYLNVYSPTIKTSNVPVMVWIHDGAFTTGTAMTYSYYGLPLVAVGDVIIVTINYRLAIFAQFSTEDDAAPGNFGMLDQVAALEWVYNNIEAFGGDKDKITIFGESAGSASVSFHLLSKLSRPYFSQAIMQSGTAFSNWAFRDDPEREQRLSTALGTAMRCNTSTSENLVACLRTKDPYRLLEVADLVYFGSYPVTLDGVFLEDNPDNLYKMGDFARVPILSGFNRDEGTLFFYFALPAYVGSPTPPHLNRTVFDATVRTALTLYGMGDEIVIDAVTQEYVDWTVADDPAADYFRPNIDASCDMDFACPTDFVVRQHADVGDTVFKYYMTHAPSKSYFQYGTEVPSTPWLGAGHAEDVPFVFGMPFIDELYHIRGHNMTEEENALSVKFMGFWTNFAKSGDPSKPSEDADPGTGDYFWPRYTIPELRHKVMSLDLPVERAVKARRCHFWNEHIPTLMEFVDNIDPVDEEWRQSYDDWKTDMEDWREVFEEYQQETTCN